MPNKYKYQQLPQVIRLLIEHPDYTNIEIARLVGLTMESPWAPVGRTRSMIEAIRREWDIVPRAAAQPSERAGRLFG